MGFGRGSIERWHCDFRRSRYAKKQDQSDLQGYTGLRWTDRNQPDLDITLHISANGTSRTRFSATDSGNVQTNEEY
jgi:hypothetical protein